MVIQDQSPEQSPSSPLQSQPCRHLDLDPWTQNQEVMDSCSSGPITGARGYSSPGWLMPLCSEQPWPSHELKLEVQARCLRGPSRTLSLSTLIPPAPEDPWWTVTVCRLPRLPTCPEFLGAAGLLYAVMTACGTAHQPGGLASQPSLHLGCPLPTRAVAPLRRSFPGTCDAQLALRYEKTVPLGGI